MISEGSCDTEDWSNDAENSALTEINYILKCYNKKTGILNCNIVKFYCFYCIFNQINAVFVNTKYLFSKTF